MTVLNPSRGSFLRVAPTGGPGPGTSGAATIDYQAGVTTNGLAMIPVNPDGTITIAANRGQVDVIIDITGYLAPAVTTVTYGYDGDGLRTSRTQDGETTTYTWDHSGPMPMLLAETTGGQTTRYIYGPGRRPIAQIRPDGTRQNLHADQIGSIIAITNTAGQPVGTFAYDPYGNRTQATGTATSNLGYAGEHTDPTTGLIYLRARWYDPATGQFLTTDPLLGMTEEPYTYGGGDPANHTDPLGLYRYSHSYKLGRWAPGTDERLLRALRRNPDTLFPFSVKGGQVTQDAVLDLEPGGGKLDLGEVKVVGVGRSYFTFEALRGHLEGAGGLVSFSITQTSRGDVYLSVIGSGPDGFWGKVPFFNDYRPHVAELTWAGMALNLRTYMEGQLGNDSCWVPT